MSKLTKKIIVPSLLVASLGLAGCHPFVKYPHPAVLSKQTAIGAAGGAATGAIVGLPAGASAIAGAGIGAYTHSTPYWLKKLQKDGVQVIQEGYKVTIVIPSDKIFVFRTDSILPHSYPILEDVTQFIQNYGTVNITVNVYTDNVGSSLGNLNLSTQQAKSVKAFLWSHGIPSKHLRSKGHGEAHTIASNDVLGSYFNRRIEIKFAYS